MTPNDQARLEKFIDGNQWIFAKTYAKTAPHEYLVYDKLSAEMQKEYDWFVKQIEEKGVDEKFYQATFRYLYVGDMKYWVHGFEAKDKGILNRDPAVNKYS
jgi:hypothetical protein